MGIGELRHRITIQKFTTVVNQNGFEIEDYEDYKNVWASVVDLRGQKIYQYAAIRAEKTMMFKIRYIKDIDTSMRIIFSNEYYYILSIDKGDYTNKYIEIKAVGDEVSGED